MHVALGGCLGPPPIRFGITADTGGHIAYVLGAAAAQARRPCVRQISIVTRLFDDPRLNADYARPRQRLDAKTTIDRIATADRAYLEKEALDRELASFIDAFRRHLAGLAARPDIIHAHFADAARAAIAARAAFDIPFVYTPHALGIGKRAGPGKESDLVRRIDAERAAITAADAIIVSTRNEAEHQVAAYGVSHRASRIKCLYPGVLDTVTSPVRRDRPMRYPSLDDPAKPIVLAIARPVRKKNLIALVRAYATTPGLVQAANLVILAGQHGDGLLSDEERAVVTELCQMRDALGLAGNMAFPPTHDARDVDALYRRAAIGGVFVNPAWHEPFGLTLIEAAAAGVPVVATSRGGPADIIAETGHGILIDPADDAAIGQACLSILSDPLLHARLSNAGRSNANSFSWSRYAERSIDLYGSLRHAETDRRAVA